MVIPAYILLILLIPALTALEHPNYNLVKDAKCGLHAPRNRIVNGVEVSPGEFPWMVAIKIERKHLNGSAINKQCGGSILNKNYVLTAAHCLVDDEEGRVLRVTTYLPNCSGCGTTIGSNTHNTNKILINPQYKKDYIERNDIALIRVDKPFSFNEVLGPVCLEHGDLVGKSYVGEYAQVSGFGAYRFTDNDWNKPVMSKLLRKLTVQMQNDTECYENVKIGVANKYWNSLNAAIWSLICVPTTAGDVDQFAYKGDSGSPLVIAKQVNSDTRPRFYQIGIVSYSISGTSATFGHRRTNLYTRVSYYLKWILDSLEP